ncbi:leucine-rich repeat-containing protein 24-like [Limulus polyphemus]|uniref:Leucine-rich repeat-containing protein 24-like n=1 Tax=Limulus polyphemus TaxID=6850 RepID=A0ABM1C0H5_LIMPO|nr:leucine-rich repeat-containing protein 24-like [Limulus polyphemus]
MVSSGSRRTVRLSTALCVFWRILVVTSTFSCHPKCNCIWRNGKQTAECRGVGFNAVPSELDSGVQVLNISRNKLRILHRDSFLQVGLVNLQKIFLANCGIDQVNEYAFNRLTNLVELDLSYNRLTIVPSGSFIHVPRLRELRLNGNPLSTLSNFAFSSAKSLTNLELINCHIHTITVKAFDGLENLEKLKLNDNNLETVSGKAMIPLKSLHSISLYDNPWKCDCELRTFRQWLDENNIPYISPTCNQPSHVKEQTWDLISIDSFSCPPQFLNTSNVVSVYEGDNVTLECRVKGDPSPSVKWIWRQRTIANFSEGISSQQTFIVSESGQREKLSRLKITFVQDPNAGAYSCIAKNLAGTQTKNFTVTVSRHPVTEVKVTNREKPQEVKEKSSPAESGEALNRGTTTGMITGIVIGAFLVLLIFAMLLWILHKRRRKSNTHTREDTTHKIGNSVCALENKEPQEGVNLNLLGANPIDRPSRLGVYKGLPTSELDPYDPLEEVMAPHVWVVNDHKPSPNPTWESSPKTDSALSLPPQIEKRPTARSPIPVPIPAPPNDLHSRLQSELADTLRRKSERKPCERERGDGSSELETTDFENTPKQSQLRDKENQKQNPDNGVPLSPLHLEGNTPDLLSHPSQVAGFIPVYENPSAYFRPNDDVTSDSKGNKLSEEGEDGTEV